VLGLLWLLLVREVPDTLDQHRGRGPGAGTALVVGRLHRPMLVGSEGTKVTVSATPC
jgi:hypothetical protein